MSDLIVPDAPDAPVGPEPYVAPEPDPEPAPAAEVPAVEVDDPDRDTFDRPYVEKLRQEAAQYRTRARQYEEAFDGYDDETRQAFLDFARLQYAAANGDEAAMAQLQEFYGDDEDDDTPDDGVPQFQSREEFEQFQRQVAREEAERLYQERESHQQQIAAVEQVKVTARAMGYDTASPDYVLLMQFANQPDVISLDDPLVEADRRVKAYQQQLVAQFTGQKAAQADTTVAAPSGNGGASAPDLSTLPWTHEMSEAQQNQAVRRSVAERFRANQNG
jgi:hypothetical protein